MEEAKNLFYKLNAHNIKDVLKSNHKMCISLYMPTHRKHPENQQDKIRYFGMIKDLDKRLHKTFENQQVVQVLDPLYRLIDDADFWNSTLDGIAVFANPDFFRVFNVPVTQNELLINSDSFHIKPLLQFMQTADSYLQEKSWALLKPKYELKLSETIEAYTNAKANNQGSDDLQQILEAILDGRVDQLLLEDHKIIFGQINASNRSLDLKEDSDSGVDDLLDDFAQLVLKMGGQVLVLPREKMPTTQGLAAIFRYTVEAISPQTKGLNLESAQTKKASDKQIELDKARAASEGMTQVPS